MTFSLTGDTTVSADTVFWTCNKPAQWTLYKPELKLYLFLTNYINIRYSWSQMPQVLFSCCLFRRLEWLHAHLFNILRKWTPISKLNLAGTYFYNREPPCICIQQIHSNPFESLRKQKQTCGFVSFICKYILLEHSSRKCIQSVCSWSALFQAWLE
jgi:hypothetical protein